jgi:hypothetical protein
MVALSPSNGHLLQQPAHMDERTRAAAAAAGTALTVTPAAWLSIEGSYVELRQMAQRSCSTSQLQNATAFHFFTSKRFAEPDSARTASVKENRPCPPCPGHSGHRSLADSELKQHAFL